MLYLPLAKFLWVRLPHSAQLFGGIFLHHSRIFVWQDVCKVIKIAAFLIDMTWTKKNAKKCNFFDWHGVFAKKIKMYILIDITAECFSPSVTDVSKDCSIFFCCAKRYYWPTLLMVFVKIIPWMLARINRHSLSKSDSKVPICNPQGCWPLQICYVFRALCHLTSIQRTSTVLHAIRVHVYNFTYVMWNHVDK